MARPNNLMSYSDIKNRLENIYGILKDNIPSEWVRSCDTSDGIGFYEENEDSWEYQVAQMVDTIIKGIDNRFKNTVSNTNERVSKIPKALAVKKVNSKLSYIKKNIKENSTRDKDYIVVLEHLRTKLKSMTNDEYLFDTDTQELVTNILNRYRHKEKEIKEN